MWWNLSQKAHCTHIPLHPGANFCQIFDISQAIEKACRSMHTTHQQGFKEQPAYAERSQ